MTLSHGWVYWALLSALFAALTAIFAKIGLQAVNPDYATLVRAVLIAAMLAVFVTASGQWVQPLQLSARTWLFLGLSALATGLSWVCYFRALQIGNASQVAPVDKLSVVLVALFAVVFLDERPTLRDWLGIAMVAMGVVLLTLRR